MRRERVAEDIYVFTSDLYAQVTASIIYTPEGCILIDTMVFPQEAIAIREYVEERLSSRVQYIINTHYHADHTYGNCLFEGAVILSHALARQLLGTRGREGLEEARRNSSWFDDVDIVLPQIVFEHNPMTLRLGKKTLELWHSPGHSPDSIVILVHEDQTLFAGDTLMTLPYFVDGSFEDLYNSLSALKDLPLENIVQGHGEVVLRGEIEEKIKDDQAYLETIYRHAQTALVRPSPEAYLRSIDIESVGKSRILLDGGIEDLHQQNMQMLFEQLSQN